MAFKEKKKYWNTVAPEDEEDLGHENYALLEFLTPKHYKIYYFFFFKELASCTIKCIILVLAYRFNYYHTDYLRA